MRLRDVILYLSPQKSIYTMCELAVQNTKQKPFLKFEKKVFENFQICNSVCKQHRHIVIHFNDFLWQYKINTTSSTIYPNT